MKLLLQDVAAHFHCPNGCASTWARLTAPSSLVQVACASCKKPLGELRHSPMCPETFKGFACLLMRDHATDHAFDVGKDYEIVTRARA